LILIKFYIRKDYGKLSLLCTIFPDVPITAFNGTATWKTQRDIFASLHLREPFCKYINEIFIGNCN
jgi:superfamily II DNA helicase RecQ